MIFRIPGDNSIQSLLTARSRTRVGAGLIRVRHLYAYGHSATTWPRRSPHRPRAAGARIVRSQ
jgi:hypothetical protein